MRLSQAPSLFSYLNIPLFVFLFYISHTQAEFWLTDSLYIENNQQLFLRQQADDIDWQLLPDLKSTQAIPYGSIVLGAKFSLEENKTDGAINHLNIHLSSSDRLITILGRQKINYNQNDIFRTSLSKNDDKVDDINYSQGLRIIHRLGYIEQSVFFNQYGRTQTTHSNALLSNASTHAINHRAASTHYQLKLGIPGYKVGPLVIALEYPSENNRILRGMLGSALQFPLGIAPGDWQWAFQYATEFNQPQPNQKAWQTSISWLGFIPQHKIGVLLSHSDEAWNYSDDFNPGQDQIKVLYQWTINQQANVELSLSQIDSQQAMNNKKRELMTANFSFSF